MKSTLEQWRMFTAVVEYGSFAKAAEAIHKSQSSINTAVHKLQDSLGVELLRIEGRRTLLTEAGALLLRRGKLVLEDVQRLEAVAASLAQGEEAVLKVAVDSIYPGERLYRAFDQLNERFPHLRIELIETILSGSNELLLAGEVPIAISPNAPPGYPTESLIRLEFVAVAAAVHPLTASATEISHEDLKAHRQIVCRDSALKEKVDSGWLKAEQRWTVSTMDTSIDLIRRSFGYAWLPRHRIAELLDSGQLRELPLAVGRTRTAELLLVISDEDKLGPAARCFVQAIRSFKDKPSK
ncbi:MAG: LysR family transcriptional regulator [Cellvibrionaceae bacterium]